MCQGQSRQPYELTRDIDTMLDQHCVNVPCLLDSEIQPTALQWLRDPDRRIAGHLVMVDPLSTC